MNPTDPSNAPMDAPAFRLLRGYTFDPSLSTTLDTARINETTFSVPWEPLEPGPIGEYLEVIDYDPASGRLYEPVNLEHPYVLAQDGLAASESSPLAHQQMVYAVAMTTIRNFERALGRKTLWGPDRDFNFVRRLRIYPHALRGANAYYSPEQKALLFGYFKPDGDDCVHAPGSTVFTCLSHDIVAHETTHALLDGMHRRYIEPTHPDSLAFHEAFADLVALFQHFTFPEVLRHQIARTRGNLRERNLLAELAQEFGQALGNNGALRNALRDKPDPAVLATTMEPHERGSILVAAVFDAFTTAYQERASRLIQLATAGSGILPPCELPGLLVDELSREAAKAASHFLNMCIRALDYSPPVGVTFGDYLRALVTADRDMVPDDPHAYRVALIDAFRRRGIFAPGVTNLSEENLAWPSGRAYDASEWLVMRLRRQLDWLRYEGDRAGLFKKSEQAGAVLHRQLTRKPGEGLYRFGQVCGLALDPKTAPPEIERDKQGLPKFEVHHFRTAFRARPDGTLMNHVILTLTQKRRMKLPDGEGSYDFRGGATLILDLDRMELRHCIARPITDEVRRAAYEAYICEELPAAIRMRFFGKEKDRGSFEPFAFLHGEHWEDDDHG
ncbi:MAG TPA: hypothetical protein VM915_08655, partial [Verrucomicrobiae bacterium]|nr:hypothetical protein [Verrucomicrobiae bacterium]